MRNADIARSGSTVGHSRHAELRFRYAQPTAVPEQDGQAASAAAQRRVEVPFDVDLQKAWKQFCFNHLFERFGKPLIIILGQKNNPPIVERL